MNSSMMTIGGRLVDLASPSPDTIDLGDIAHHLSLVNRFNGAVIEPYSVAAHSLYVSSVLLKDFPRHIRLQGLMHDAAEAYTNDMIQPLKQFLPEYKEVENRVWEAIAERFGLAVKLDPVIKLADRVAFQVEHYRLRLEPMGRMDEHGCEGLVNPRGLYGDFEQVRDSFIATYYELQTERVQGSDGQTD